MKRVLSISGGGMRGVIPGRMLVEIERRVGRPLWQVFDLIAGTSTGSILAALCVSPKIVPATEALQFYFEAGPRIFKRGWCDFGIFGAKYSSADLEREVRICVGEWKCRDVLTKALLPTVDADSVEAEFIKTWAPAYRELPLWAAACASSSAQTFFPAFSIGVDGRERRYLDGGNHTNNPAASAMFEAFRLWPGEEILVVHLGTGKQRNPKALPDGGMARWAPLVFGTVSECQDDCAKYYCSHAPGVRFMPFDVSIERFPAIDACDERTLNGLVKLTDLTIASQSSRWDDLVEALNPVPLLA